MKIKKKIIISNILMVGIPIICAGLIGFIGGKRIDSKYMYSLENMFEDENAVVTVQSTIYAYQEELWETNWKEMEEEEIGHQDENTDEGNIKWSELNEKKNELRQTNKMYNLGKEMEYMGYHFSVFMDGDCQYSNMTKIDSETLQQVVGSAITHVRSLVAGEGEASIIKNTFEKDNVLCVIIAVNSGNRIENTNGISYLKRYLIQFVIWFLILVVLVIFITNAVLSGVILDCILTPLRKLSEGSKRIRSGDLDTPITYKKKDEIGEVCEDFEDMRGYLKESAEIRIQYENYRRELISGISHDLRTPLTSIKGYLEGLTMGIAKDQAMQERYFAAMKTRTNDMECLVDNLTCYNKLESHMQKYQMQRIELKSFIESYIEERTLEYEKEAIYVQMKVKDNTYNINMDPFQLVRVFNNLFSNTIKYRKDTQSKVWISLEYIDNQIYCMYEDNAGGVPVMSLDRLFDSFYRVDDARNNAGNSSGLGLAIVKEIIVGQGGSIHAENGIYGLRIVMTIPEMGEIYEDTDC